MTAPKRCERHRIIMFAAVGGIATVAYFGLATGLAVAGVPAWLSSLTAYGIAGGLSYFGHCNLSFQSRQPHTATAPKFLYLSAFQYLLALAIPAGLSDYASYSPVVAFGAVCIVLPLTSFLLMSTYVFAAKI